jgi:hypothetical protein
VHVRTIDAVDPHWQAQPTEGRHTKALRRDERGAEQGCPRKNGQSFGEWRGTLTVIKKPTPDPF